MSIYERIVNYISNNEMALVYFILIEAGGFEDEVNKLKKYLHSDARQILELEKSRVINIDCLVGDILDKAKKRYA